MIDRAIALVHSVLPLLPRSPKEHTDCVQDLVDLRYGRYERSHDKEDLDKSIVHCTEAILLLPVSRDIPYSKNAFRLLFRLAQSLLERSREFNQPEDIKHLLNTSSTFEDHPFILSTSPESTSRHILSWD